jgi:predicted dehydrogenase
MGKANQSRVAAQLAPTSRRTFLKTSAATAVGGMLTATPPVAKSAQVSGSDIISLGLVGCGGRGSGAAVQALTADPNTRLVAVADAFEDRLALGLNSIKRQMEGRVEVDRDHQFTGFDGYKRVIESDVDVVLLATPPHFRPMHLRAAIEAGKHVFAEKPVAVDAPGVRSVLETTELARQLGLSIVSGLNSRYSPAMQQLMARIHDGAIGEVLALYAVRYAEGVWVRPRRPEMTEMEYQMQNWYYFTWLSGDFNVEQFVHQYDQVAWAMQDVPPASCYSTGGRQQRTGPEHGHIYDHFASTFEYAQGARAFMTTRHQKGCTSESAVVVMGTKGQANLSRRRAGITGENPWRFPDGEEKDSHQLEHDTFFAELRAGRIINNGEYMAKSTLIAVMDRMSAYTGQTLTWDQVMNSKEHLAPSAYTWDAEPPEAVVAVPGVTRFV